MPVLLIWDSCGLDPIKLYSVSGPSIEIALAADTQYVNSDPDDAASQINDLIAAPHPDFTELDGKSVVGPFQAIVRCGFLP
jgi:hypothetical protein